MAMSRKFILSDETVSAILILFVVVVLLLVFSDHAAPRQENARDRWDNMKISDRAKATQHQAEQIASEFLRAK